MRRAKVIIVLGASFGFALSTLGCGSTPHRTDSGVTESVEDGGEDDAGVHDGGASDSGVPDGGADDVGVPDGGAGRRRSPRWWRRRGLHRLPTADVLHRLCSSPHQKGPVDDVLLALRRQHMLAQLSWAGAAARRPVHRPGQLALPGLAADADVHVHGHRPRRHSELL